MKHSLITLCIALTGLLASTLSCGGPSTKPGDTNPAGYRPHDRQAYDEGQARAEEMLRTWGGDTAAVQEYLLDFHCVCGDVAARRGKTAVEDMRRGFADHVAESDPGLAAAIFD